MCGLSLAWVTSENSTMLLESDSSWLTLAGPYPMLPRLSAPVSGVDCPSVDPRQPLCSPLSVQPPTAPCWVASSTLIRVPLPLPDTARFHVQESFVWFRAKTDSSALAAYPHSATLVLWVSKTHKEWNKNNSREIKTTYSFSDERGMSYFVLASLFNGISIFIGYFKSKLF